MPLDAEAAPQNIDLAPYRRAIEARICSFCVDHCHDGTCGRPRDEPCAINHLLAVLVHVVLTTDCRTDVEGFVERMRTELCPTCLQDSAGHCPRRALAHCTVDSYLLPIIDIIEDVAVEHGHM